MFISFEWLFVVSFLASYFYVLYVVYRPLFRPRRRKDVEIAKIGTTEIGIGSQSCQEGFTSAFDEAKRQMGLYFVAHYYYRARIAQAAAEKSLSASLAVLEGAAKAWMASCICEEDKLTALQIYRALRDHLDELKSEYCEFAPALPDFVPDCQSRTRLVHAEFIADFLGKIKFCEIDKYSREHHLAKIFFDSFVAGRLKKVSRAEYAALIRSHAAIGGTFKIEERVNEPIYYCLQDVELPPLYGSASLSIIVPRDRELVTLHDSHCRVYRVGIDEIPFSL